MRFEDGSAMERYSILVMHVYSMPRYFLSPAKVAELEPPVLLEAAPLVAGRNAA